MAQHSSSDESESSGIQFESPVFSNKGKMVSPRDMLKSRASPVQLKPTRMADRRTEEKEAVKKQEMSTKSTLKGKASPNKGKPRPNLDATLPRGKDFKVNMSTTPINIQAEMFDEISEGTDATYRIDKTVESWDSQAGGTGQTRFGRRTGFDGSIKQCWICRGNGSEAVFNVRGGQIYRMAMAYKITQMEEGQERTALEEMFFQIGRQKGAMLVRHMCGNGECCNPDHLRLGTQQENGRDWAFHHFARQSEALRQCLWQESEETRGLW